MQKILGLFLFGIVLLTNIEAKDYEIKMLDMDKKGHTMVFDPPFLQIQPGDTITFIPTHKSHFAQSKVIPDGAEHFLSPLDQKTTFQLNQEGVYLYVCPPHQMMNMVGIIQVGKAVNMQEIRSALPKLERKAMTNKGRFLEYAKQIQE
ncbi:pseudoazurin [Helicobacter monodelphidis]|uniref:plastocyanin/azurin family copper-binding protein n=1 Tax=Helicobacter sp. 15-1451 TaxID=2004995 RepID=UPI000DCF11D1|nr:plastocyanin/azurin family copper-binding protein [Helicobacter sp. 15-1451]RAX57713.1 pseudoazurin [Helicobacter sp. 15-1451]